MAKAQITGQVFVYIMAIIVVGLVFLLGYKYISTLIPLKCDAERTSFVKTIEKYADNYDGYGEISSEKIKAPCEYKQVCFVDTNAIKIKETEGIYNLIIKASVGEGSEQNIFLIGKKTEAVGYSKKIAVKDNIVCINKTGTSFNIRFKGDSEKTFVEGFE